MAKLRLTAPKRTRKPKVVADALTGAADTGVSKPPTKIATITALLARPEGASLAELMAATGWQAHSVRGALSGAIKKQLKLPVISVKSEAGRVYRLAEPVAG